MDIESSTVPENQEPPAPNNEEPVPELPDNVEEMVAQILTRENATLDRNVVENNDREEESNHTPPLPVAVTLQSLPKKKPRKEQGGSGNVDPCPCCKAKHTLNIRLEGP